MRRWHIPCDHLCTTSLLPVNLMLYYYSDSGREILYCLCMNYNSLFCQILYGLYAITMSMHCPLILCKMMLFYLELLLQVFYDEMTSSISFFSKRHFTIFCRDQKIFYKHLFIFASYYITLKFNNLMICHNHIKIINHK